MIAEDYELIFESWRPRYAMIVPAMIMKVYDYMRMVALSRSLVCSKDGGFVPLAY